MEMHQLHLFFSVEKARSLFVLKFEPCALIGDSDSKMSGKEKLCYIDSNTADNRTFTTCYKMLTPSGVGPRQRQSGTSTVHAYSINDLNFKQL